ncbi:hypothetical protein FACS1894162_6370 [Bacteroidia bacterium]|nr:hypothetical protein FACS1894162_6370 [Bacteroidia bacterium]
MKMKKVILMMLLLGGAVSVNAQVRIGGTAAADAAAILDLNPSTGNTATKALALPRTASEPTSATPAGMLIYHDGKVKVSTGSAWKELGSGTGGGVVDPPVDPPTPPTFTCGTDDVTGQSGGVYKTGDFGAAGCWMTENLRDSLGLIYKVNVLAANYTDSAYQYPDNKGANVATHGLLYTWAAATGRTGISTEETEVNVTTDTLIQGICPTDWHIPTDAEWSELETVIATDATNNYATDGAVEWPLSNSSATGWRPSTATASVGNKLRAAGTAGNPPYAPTSNAYDAANGKRGFAALLAGSVAAGAPTGFGTATNIWAASSSTDASAWYRIVNSTHSGAYRGAGAKSRGYSVRCKKN